MEKQIEKLEGELKDIEAQLADPKNGTDLPLLQELSKKQSAASEKLAALYEAWEELAGD